MKGNLSCLILVLVTSLFLQSCFSMISTDERIPVAPKSPIPAKVGLHLNSDNLKKLFYADGGEFNSKFSGAFFSSVTPLPPDSQYLSPQEIYEQYGMDLVVGMQFTDWKMDGGINPLFALCFPLTWGCMLTPLSTNEITMTIETTVRDTRTGRLLSTHSGESFARTTAAPNSYSMEASMEVNKMSATKDSVIQSFEKITKDLGSYVPGSISETMPSSAVKKKSRLSKDPKRYAVVIGVEKYRERLPDADYASSDARDVADFLINNAGFSEQNVVLRTNEQATKSDLEKYLNGWLKNNLDSSSSLVVYFSGHGTPKTDTGEGYLVPYDGDPTFIEQTGLSLKALYSTLESLPAKEVVVMLDACFTGTGDRSVLPTGAKPLVINSQQRLNSNSKKTVVLASTSGNTISLSYKAKKHGLFTYFVLQGLSGDAANSDGSVDIQGLYSFIKPQVQRIARREFNTDQTPQLIIPNALVNKAPVKIINN